MCKRLILDTDTSHIVLDDKTNRKRDRGLRDWIAVGYGVLCYTTEGKLGKETIKTKKYMAKLETWQARGRAFRVSAAKLFAAREALKSHTLRSNDADVVALAIAGEAQILGTQDGRLKQDLQRIVPSVTKGTILLYPVGECDEKKTRFLAGNRCKVLSVSSSGS